MTDFVKKYKKGITLEPQDANPSNPQDGQFQNASSSHSTLAEGTYRYNAGTASWEEMGGGAGGGLDVFHTEQFEKTVDASSFTSGNNATFDNGGTLDGTLSDETSSPIAGTKSLKYVMSTSSTNDWIKSPVIDIEEKQAGECYRSYSLL